MYYVDEQSGWYGGLLSFKECIPVSTVSHQEDINKESRRGVQVAIKSRVNEIDQRME